VVPSAAQIYEHVRVLFVIADPLDEAASADRVAFEGGEIDGSAVFYICDLVLLRRRSASVWRANGLPSTGVSFGRLGIWSSAALVLSPNRISLRP
jgi:hypothetical protein